MTLLAIHPGALGDVILFGHLLTALGGARTLIAGGEKAALLVGLGRAERPLPFDALPMHEVFDTDVQRDAGVSPALCAPLNLSSENTRASLPPDAGRMPARYSGETPASRDGSPAQYRLPQYLAGHERLVSCFATDAPAATMLTALAGVEAASFLPVRPPADFQGHLLQLWADLLGIDADLHPAPWPVPAAWQRDAGILPALCGPLGVSLENKQSPSPSDAGEAPASRPLAVIHPGSGGRAKCWPTDRFAALSHSLERAGMRVAWMLGPVELDTWPADILETIRRRHAVFDNPSLPQLAGLLARASVFIGNDSGPAHLAAAIGTPTVALFGPSNPTHFRPLGQAVRVIVESWLENIQPDEVAEAIREITQNDAG